ncbi:CsbD family protein [Phenylobacterium sp.]|uniref:CsbD family protein n=1 Tax=Phenylobacterium sp. TaxID=1871053 RepID=UPI00121A1ABA|nr:CsbD family protein [Phenylobacterium sp.]THD57450.1 MAG: CsbD family protein [Phenylobacterium sp.]
MNRDTAKGATQKAVGSIKEAAGKATGNKKLQAKGVADKAAGSAREVVGKTKTAVKKATR